MCFGVVDVFFRCNLERGIGGIGGIGCVGGKGIL